MNKMIDISVIINESYQDPKIVILTKERTEQVESIIYSIENAYENGFPLIRGNMADKIIPLSQRDIIRVYIEGHKNFIQTDSETYTTKQPLSSLEDLLNKERFIRISQSEIINLYKVKCVDLATVGTVKIEFDNGTHSWVARRRVKAIKDRLQEMFIRKGE